MEEEGSREEKEQALATFNHAADEIRFFKGQQWHVANYALIAYAALVAAPRMVGGWLSWVCVGLVVVVGLAALVLLRSLEEALAKERGRMLTARCQYLPLIQQIHDGDIRVYRSSLSDAAEAPRWLDALSRWLGPWFRWLGPWFRWLDASLWLYVAVTFGAVLALALIILPAPVEVCDSAGAARPT